MWSRTDGRGARCADRRGGHGDSQGGNDERGRDSNGPTTNGGGRKNGRIVRAREWERASASVYEDNKGRARPATMALVAKRVTVGEPRSAGR